ncbi:hypothetical protein [Polaromonas sp. CG9_12]|nr:hypothetical protein [Polaromonas sp. CG9_12]
MTNFHDSILSRSQARYHGNSCQRCHFQFHLHKKLRLENYL